MQSRENREFRRNSEAQGSFGKNADLFPRLKPLSCGLPIVNMHIESGLPSGLIVCLGESWAVGLFGFMVRAFDEGTVGFGACQRAAGGYLAQQGRGKQKP